MGYDMRDQWTQKLRDRLDQDFQFHCSENLNRIIGTICRKHRSEISTGLEENIDNDLSFIGILHPPKVIKLVIGTWGTYTLDAYTLSYTLGELSCYKS